MMRTIAIATLMIVAGSLSVAAQTQTTAAPAPGSPATYVSGERLSKIISSSTVANGGTVTAGVTNTDIYRVNVVRRAGPSGPALAHEGNTELHYILEGSATVITGGTLIRGNNGRPSRIENGVTQRVTKGDIIIVPENSAHQYSQIDGVITYLEVRWLAPR